LTYGQRPFQTSALFLVLLLFIKKSDKEERESQRGQPIFTSNICYSEYLLPTGRIINDAPCLRHYAASNCQ
jgi:hypothetical protein